MDLIIIATSANITDILPTQPIFFIWYTQYHKLLDDTNIESNIVLVAILISTINFTYFYSKLPCTTKNTKKDYLQLSHVF